jgi:hypothetical protein
VLLLASLRQLWHDEFLENTINLSIYRILLIDSSVNRVSKQIMKFNQTVSISMVGEFVANTDKNRKYRL